MKQITLVYLLLCMAFSSAASTSISTPTVSGHWTLSGSPYIIHNDIGIDACATLTIDPGVQVRFAGYYKLRVQGQLIANGNDTQRIVFGVEDTTQWSNLNTAAGGWAGITWDAYFCTPNDSTTFKYCDITDVKAYSIFVNYVRGKLEYCNFYHNLGGIFLIATPTQSLEMSHCGVFNNVAKLDTFGFVNSIIEMGYYGDGPACKYIIHDCDIHDNVSLMPIVHAQYINLEFYKNKMHDNVARDSMWAHGTLFVDRTVCTIRDNQIYNNVDAENAALHSNNSTLLLERNYICNNMSMNGMATGYMCGANQGGGGIRIAADIDSTRYHALVRNNIIANNFSGFGGGGIYVINANVEIVNNQIVNNSGSRGGGITFNNYPSTLHTKGVIKNNLFYNNVSIDYYDTGTGPMQGHIDTSDVFTAFGDSVLFENNFVTKPVYKTLCMGAPYAYDSLVVYGDSASNVIAPDPKLIAPTHTWNSSESAMGADFGLQPTSPCINKGTVSGINPGSTDYAVNTRIFGLAIDIGAYEYGGTPYLSATETLPAEKAIKVYPNPASGALYVATPAINGTIVLYDITGHQVSVKSVISNLTSFDIHTLPVGIYVVGWLNSDNKQQLQKVVVQ